MLMKQEEQKKSINRLNRIEGQIRGLKKMIEDDIYCIDVISQTSSVRSALKGLEDALMENHLSTCVVSQIKNGKEKKAVDEIIKVYKLKR